MLGKTLGGRYQLEQLLQKDQTGTLFLATENVSGEAVAIRTLPGSAHLLRTEPGLRYLRLMARLEGEISNESTGWRLVNPHLSIYFLNEGGVRVLERHGVPLIDGDIPAGQSRDFTIEIIVETEFDRHFPTLRYHWERQ